MNKHILDLYDNGLGDDIKQYMTNVQLMSKIKNCVTSCDYSSNVYRNVASFEDAGIAEASDVPAGTEKQKMNYLLVQAIQKAAPMVNANLKLAATAAKTWNDNVKTSDDNQQERLNAATARLRTAAKSSPIPSYSDMSDEQRARVQAVFQSVLKKSEPLAIDYISDVIDRYNAGADKTVLFKVLELQIDYSTALTVYDQESYDSLMSDSTFNCLFEQWKNYQDMVKVIAESKRMDAVTLSDIVAKFKYSTQNHSNHSLTKAVANIDFNEVLSSYNQNSKSTTSYDDIKPHLNGLNIVKPMSVNSRNRLLALCDIIGKLESYPVQEIVESQTDMENDDIYAALSGYFDVIEQTTQNLMVFMFLTQTTTRNYTLIEDVITTIGKVDSIIDSLFTKVHNATGEDGVISEEGFKDMIKSIVSGSKKVDDGSKTLDVTKEKLLFDRNLTAYNELSNSLLRLKLREHNSLNDRSIKTFIDKHAKTIKTLFNCDVTKMSIEEIYTFMTSDIFHQTISFSEVAALTSPLYFDNSPRSKSLLELLNNEESLSRLISEPFGRNDGSFQSDSFKAATLVNAMCNELKELNSKTIDYINYETLEFVNAGSNFTRQEDWQEVFNGFEITRVPAVLYKHPATRADTFLGYRQINTSTLSAILSYFTPDNTRKVNLNNIGINSGLKTIAKNSITYAKYDTVANQFYESGGAHSVIVNNINDAADEIKGLNNVIAKLPNVGANELVSYKTLNNAIVEDMESALIDAAARAKLAKITALSSSHVVETLRNLYGEFNEIAEDFIAITK